MDSSRQSDSASSRRIRNLEDVYGEVFGDHRNKTGIKGDVETLKTRSDSQEERLDAVSQRVSKLESNWFKKIWLWAVSSGTIGTVLGGMAVWWFTN